MTLKYGPNLGQLIGAAAGDEHYQAILSQWRALDGLVQPAISSRVTTLPTTDMLEGDRYLVTSGTYANRIARYREANTEAGLGAGWEYFTPREGWYVWSVADKRGYRFSNGGWIDATFQGGTLSTALNEAPIVSLASAATLAIGAAAANTIQVTGTTAITAFDTTAAGARRTLRFSDALTLTHNATSLILPRGANIVTVAGDVAVFVSLGGGNWVCVGYQRSTAADARGDLSVDQVDNTSDAKKPISTATQAALNTRVTLDTQQTITGRKEFTNTTSFSGQVNINSINNANIELGYTGGTGSTPYMDFHSGATATDYDFRIIAGGGTGVAGGGYMTLAGASLYVNPVTWFYKPMNLFVSGASAQMQLSGDAGQYKLHRFSTGGTVRFDVGVDNTSEGGNNAGSNYYINRFSDTGGFLGTPLNINRATGLTTLTSLAVNGPLTAAGFASTAPIRPGQYTLSSLPSASAYSGYEIDVTDASGGPKRCRSNGTDWQILNTTIKVS